MLDLGAKQEREQGTVLPQVQKGGAANVRFSTKQTPKLTQWVLKLLRHGVVTSWHYCKGHGVYHTYISAPGEPVPWCPLENAEPLTGV